MDLYEATWRIFGFPIHGRKPVVERLHFHLPRQHSVLYQDHDDIDAALSNPSISDSKFISWMNSDQSFAEGRTLMQNLFLSSYIIRKKDPHNLEKKDTLLRGYYGSHQLQENYFT